MATRATGCARLFAFKSHINAGRLYFTQSNASAFSTGLECKRRKEKILATTQCTSTSSRFLRFFIYAHIQPAEFACKVLLYLHVNCLRASSRTFATAIDIWINNSATPAQKGKRKTRHFLQLNIRTVTVAVDTGKTRDRYVILPINEYVRERGANNIFPITASDPVRDVVVTSPDVSAMTVLEFSRLSETEVDGGQVRSRVCIHAIVAVRAIYRSRDVRRRRCYLCMIYRLRLPLSKRMTLAGGSSPSNRIFPTRPCRRRDQARSSSSSSYAVSLLANKLARLSRRWYRARRGNLHRRVWKFSSWAG